MKLSLKLLERLLCLELMPKNDGFVGLKSIRKAKETLSLTADEEELHGYVFKDGHATWEPDHALEEKEFELEEYVVSKIKEALMELNSSKKLEEFHVSLYEKIVGG